MNFLIEKKNVETFIITSHINAINDVISKARKGLSELRNKYSENEFKAVVRVKQMPGAVFNHEKERRIAVISYYCKKNFFYWVVAETEDVNCLPLNMKYQSFTVR